MAHEIGRLLAAFAARAWAIEPAKGSEIVAALAFRAAHGPRTTPYRGFDQEGEGSPAPAVVRSEGAIRVLSLFGPILPRAEAVTDISAPAALLSQFQIAFKAAASDPAVSAIVLDIDSPGGQADLVAETADMIFKARRSDRPIVSVADTLACSAAYWIASQADELVVTPSGLVGSIGVYTVHEDDSEFLAKLGVKMTMITEGARKAENHPFAPLSPEAKAALQDNVAAYYGMFVKAVARGMSRPDRKVTAEIVKADPESGKPSFGGGRAYTAQKAVSLGMADRVESLDQVIARLRKR